MKDGASTQATEDRSVPIMAEQPTAGEPAARRIPPIAEAFGYIGVALAFAALATLVAMFWEDLGVWGRTGVSAVVAIAGLAGGLLLERLEKPAARRLSQFLLAIGVAGVGCAVGFIAQHIAIVQIGPPMRVSLARETASEWAWFLGMFAAAIAGGLVWWKRHAWLQHLVFGGAVGLSTLLVLPLIPTEGPDWAPGLVLAAVGIVWGALALRGLVPPENAGLSLACLGILGGIQLSAANAAPPGKDLLPWAVWLGLGASGVLAVLVVRLKRYVVLGFGAAGLVMFSIEVVTVVFTLGMAMPLILLGTGLALVWGAAYATMRVEFAEKPVVRIATEIAGYAGIALAFVGTTTLLGEYGDELGTALKIAVPALCAVAAYAAGILVERTPLGFARRLSQTFFAAGVVGVSVSVGLAAHAFLENRLGPPMFDGEYRPLLDAANWAGIVGALAGVATGFVTWWFKRGAVTLVATGGACFMAVSSAMSIGFEMVQPWVPGVVLLAVGALWLAFGLLERLTPSNWAVGIGLVLADIGMLMAQRTPAGEPVAWPLYLGLALSVTSIAASIWLKRGVMLGVGAAGVVLFSFAAATSLFEGQAAAPVILLITGVIFIAMAVLVAVMLPRMRRSDGKLPAGGTPANA